MSLDNARLNLYSALQQQRAAIDEMVRDVGMGGVFDRDLVISLARNVVERRDKLARALQESRFPASDVTTIRRSEQV